jgi:hypothetical protein
MDGLSICVRNYCLNKPTGLVFPFSGHGDILEDYIRTVCDENGLIAIAQSLDEICANRGARTTEAQRGQIRG